jgi:hypothetical protein
MNKVKKSVVVAVSLGLLLTPALAGCVANAPTVTASPTPISKTTVDEVVLQMKQQAPEAGTDAALAWEALTGADGEYAAAASYQAVLDQFGQVEPYSTILAAELRHVNALTRQLEGMGVTVPSNPYLGVVSAPADLKTAAKAWAQGEILNVQLYDELLSEADSTNLVRVFTNLRRASQESHLPMFELAAAGDGTLAADQVSGMQGSGGMHG